MRRGGFLFRIGTIAALLWLSSAVASVGAADYTAEFKGGSIDTDGIQVLPSEWMADLLAREDWLTGPRYEFHLTDEVVLNNCVDFFAVRDQPELWYRATTRLQHGEYVPCGIAALLERARTPRRSYFADTDLAEDVAGRLNLLSTCSSLTRRYRSRQTLSIFDIESTVTTVSETGFSIEEGSWDRHLSLLARTDVTGDGVEDVLVTFVDDSREGTYFIIKVLVLTTDGPSAPIIALDGRDLVRSYSGTCEDILRRGRGEME